MDFSKYLILLMILILVSLTTGCTNSSNATLIASNTPPPTQTIVPNTPTFTSTPAEPTSTMAPTFIPTPSMFFTNNFDNESSDWTHFSIDGERSVLNKEIIGINLSAEDGYWIYNIEKDFEWVYSIYELNNYDDVRIDAIVANRGSNLNNISLVCRYSEDDGWYEFNISNGGYFYIYRALPRFDGFVSYTELGRGGSNDIKQGAETNTYSSICQGDTLTLLINGTKVKEVQSGQIELTNGKIGISVSSFLQIPVKVKFDTITVSQPELQSGEIE